MEVWRNQLSICRPTFSETQCFICYRYNRNVFDREANSILKQFFDSVGMDDPVTKVYTVVTGQVKVVFDHIIIESKRPAGPKLGQCCERGQVFH